MLKFIKLHLFIPLSIACVSIISAINTANAASSAAAHHKMTPDSIFASNLMFYFGAGLMIVICGGLLIFAYSLLPKRIKTCTVSIFAKARKIIIPNRKSDIVIKPDAKEFSDIISNLLDQRQLPDAQIPSVNIIIYANNTKYLLQISMSGWNFLGEEKNCRRLLNNIQAMNAISLLLDKLRDQK